MNLRLLDSKQPIVRPSASPSPSPTPSSTNDPSDDIPPPAELPYAKMYSGHYISLGAARTSDPMPDALNEIKGIPGVVGVQRRYYWSDLHTGPGVYQFNRIKADLATVQSAGKKLSIFISWKFRTDQGNDPVPAFLKSMTSDPVSYALGGANLGPSASGFVAAMNNPVVAAEFIRFLKALSAEIDAHSALASVVFPETALGTDLAGMTEAQKTQLRTAFYDRVLEIDVAAAKAFKHTPVIQLSNFPVSRLDLMTQTYVRNGVAMGGPDVWLNDPTLKAYAYYPRLSGIIPLGILVAGGNLEWFNHEDEVAQDETRKIPYAPSETIQRLADKAVGELRTNFVFWRRLGPADPFYVAFLQHVRKLGTPQQTIPPAIVECPSFYEGNCRH